MTFSGLSTLFPRIPFSKMTDFLGLSLLDKLFATNIIGKQFVEELPLETGWAYSWERIFEHISYIDGVLTASFESSVCLYSSLLKDSIGLESLLNMPFASHAAVYIVLINGDAKILTGCCVSNFCISLIGTFFYLRVWSYSSFY